MKAMQTVSGVYILSFHVQNGKLSIGVVAQAPFSRTPQQGPRGPRGGFAPGPFGPPQNFVMVGPGGRAYPGPGGRAPRGPRMNGPQYGAMQQVLTAPALPSLRPSFRTVQSMPMRYILPAAGTAARSTSPVPSMSRVPGGWWRQRLLRLRHVMSVLTKGPNCRVDADVVPCRAAAAREGPMLATMALRTAL